ncbi:MAG: stage V sporulation protein AD [Ruminococcus sp.]|nr:stage V sporulation protein AD [Ruminococcus sp.]
MAEFLTQGVFSLNNPAFLKGFAAVAGTKEGEGALGSHFDRIVEDSHFGRKTWEQAESQFQLEAVRIAAQKACVTADDIDVICSGDLINQCIGSTYGLRELGVPFLGIYGACSTMAEGLAIASLLLDGGGFNTAAAVTSSHFSTAERQFRAPLSYGGQRTPTSQWTATAAGAAILGEGGNCAITGGCIGKIADMGISDITNMGSAMAPAAADTIFRYLSATSTSPSDYDRIITGDLGLVGSRLLLEIMDKQGIDLSAVHCDCGVMLYDIDAQDVHCGGSGCGCSASVLCGYFLPEMAEGKFNRLLFIATGALMSPMSLQQGESIPSVAHLVEIRRFQ